MSQRHIGACSDRTNHRKQSSEGSVKEPNKFHNYETEKITRRASDVAENLQLYRVVRFFRPRSSCTTHLMLFSERPPIYHHHDLLRHKAAQKIQIKYNGTQLKHRYKIYGKQTI